MTKQHEALAARLRHASIIAHEPDPVRTRREIAVARDTWAVCVENVARALDQQTRNFDMTSLHAGLLRHRRRPQRPVGLGQRGGESMRYQAAPDAVAGVKARLHRDGVSFNRANAVRPIDATRAALDANQYNALLNRLRRSDELAARHEEERQDAR